ncbi:hypothetical protein, partial [Candidatus Ichthyocystis hellenicum]|uniref:hypothetical protein n=1 Tax=Candidatus Ichthyocystis hellenicum TaxID=1561003 RepID=UPI0015853FBE
IDKSKLDNVRLEFVGSLGLIVEEVVSNLGCKNSDVYNVVYERSHNFFKKGGLLDMVESVLSGAKAVDYSGKYRFITDEEKEYILKEFMDVINSDRDCLIKKRTGELKNIYLPTTVDLFAKLSADCRATSANGINVAREHSYAKKLHENIS